MARPCRWRRICDEPMYRQFTPDGIPAVQNVELMFDEYEAIRLIDLMKYTHAQCAAQMDISRTTVTEIYESARAKIADSLINGKTLVFAVMPLRAVHTVPAAQYRHSKSSEAKEKT